MGHARLHLVGRPHDGGLDLQVALDGRGGDLADGQRLGVSHVPRHEDLGLACPVGPADKTLPRQVASLDEVKQELFQLRIGAKARERERWKAQEVPVGIRHMGHGNAVDPKQVLLLLRPAESGLVEVFLAERRRAVADHRHDRNIVPPGHYDLARAPGLLQRLRREDHHEVLATAPDSFEQEIQALQVVGVEEDLGTAMLSHHDLEEAAEAASALLVVAEEGPECGCRPEAAVDAVANGYQAGSQRGHNQKAQQHAQQGLVRHDVNLEERCCTEEDHCQEEGRNHVGAVRCLRPPGPQPALQSRAPQQHRAHGRHLDHRRGHQHHRHHGHGCVADEEDEAVVVVLDLEPLVEEAVAVHEAQAFAGLDARGVFDRRPGSPGKNGHGVAERADGRQRNQDPVLR
mmetsp:Transcript_84360/g.239138  ORF Transcript_84360/g.239138 Transcript_84360/m.239138 type:complete len:402 (+) Transcript_84360:898-2103(+)